MQSEKNISAALAEKIFSLIDLTSLNETDSEKTILSLCQKAVIANIHVATVCVYPQFVRTVKAALKQAPVKVATVANFPQGNDSLEVVLQSIESAVQSGAKEIDIVFPYKKYLAGDRAYTQNFMDACKKICEGDILLKVILETGALQDLAVIAAVSEDLIACGVDFLKTSTGKIAVGATVEAAAVMLATIKKANRPVGLKISGGVRTPEQAIEYMELASQIMGSEWVNPKTFRIGASQLVDNLTPIILHG